MLATTMQSAMAQALRASGRAVSVRSLSSSTSRVVVARRSFPVASSYKACLAVRGYATATATRKKTTTAKKPAAKRTAVRKAAPAKKKKTAAKKPKAKSKAKKVTAKKKPVKRVKKETSPEKKQMLLKRELRKKAMLNQEPKKEPSTPWMVYLFDQIKGDKTLNVNFASKVKEVAAQFKNISPSEKQRLQDRADQNKAVNATNYKKWVETHPVLDVAAANNARARLIREFDAKITPQKITDERMPKRPVTGFAQFVKARSVAMDGPATQVMKSLSAQWKTFSAADKKPYEDLTAAETVRYTREMERIAA